MTKKNDISGTDGMNGTALSAADPFSREASGKNRTGDGGVFRRVLKWSAAAVLLTLLLAVAGGICAVFLLPGLLYGKPVCFPDALKPSDYAALNTAGRKLADAFLDEKGKMKKEAALVLSAEETAALLHFASRFGAVRKKWGSAAFFLEWNRSAVDGRVCLRLKSGKCVNLSFRAVPSAVRGKVGVRLERLAAGRIEVPPFLLGVCGRRIAARTEAEPNFAKLKKAIVEAGAASDGGFRIVFDTAALAEWQASTAE